MRPALVIGITGGIGSGKTTVADLFGALGVPVIDADELARRAVMPGEPAYEDILAALGDSVLAESGELDRRRMRERAFSDPGLRHKLESIIHPRVYAQIEKRLGELRSAYAIVVVPLLIESGGLSLVDRVLVVDADREQQIKRTSERDGTARKTIENILDAQVSRDARLAAADDVVQNNGSINSLEQAVSRLHQQYLDEAARVASARP